MDDRDEAMKELVRGRELAKQLEQHLSNNNNINDELASPLFAQHLVSNVVNSFSNTLFLLNKHHQREQNFSLTIKSEEESQDSYKTSSTRGARGSHKRRKTTETCEEVSERPTDDGHEWRKYGQKTILNSKYSRDYYRCTHKFNQRCQATKQVQRIQEKPPLYKTTYYGHHTCNKDNIIFEPTSPHDNTTSSILLSFNNTFPTPTEQDCPFLSSSTSSSSSFNSSLSVEYCKENSPSLDEYLLSPEPILDKSISTRHVRSTLSSSTTLESDDHRDMMIILYGLLYDSVELDTDFLHPFHGFQL